MCVREARQSSEAAVRQEQLMKSLIDHEEEQRRSRQLADSAIRKDKVSSWRPLSSCYANLHMNVISIDPCLVLMVTVSMLSMYFFILLDFFRCVLRTPKYRCF